MKAKLVNAFIVEQDKIMLLTWYRTILFNTDLEQIAVFDVSEMGDYIKGLHCCSEDLSSDRKGYLISFAVEEFSIDEGDFDHVEQEVANN